MNTNRILAVTLSAIVTIAIVAGIIVAGTPAEERTRRADEQRVTDLQNLTYAIDTHYVNEGTLPETTEQAARQPNVYVQRITDPQSNEPYTYRATGETTYQLCATFEEPTPAVPERAEVPPELSFWSHDAGTHCYDFDADIAVNALKPIPVR